MNTARAALLLCAALLLSAAPADAKRKKDDPTAAHTAGATTAGPWLAPRKNFFIRQSFDADPMLYVGRFLPAGAETVSEADALEMPCSPYITEKVVDASGMSFDEYFAASSSAKANLGIPDVLGAGTDGAATSVVRVRYETAQKMQYEIADPAGFEACCQRAPGQCSERFVGEFLSGTGEVFYSVGTEAELKAKALSTDYLAGLEVKDGRYWRSSLTFTKPLYFAFSVTSCPNCGGGDLPSGHCADPGVTWDDTLPRSSQGQYFVGTSQVLDSESSARDDALRSAKQQALAFGGETVTTITATTTTTSGSGSGVGSQVSGSSTLEGSAAGVVSRLGTVAWCDANVALPTGGYDYVYKALVFLPSSPF
ncbi:MAG: hypothetical protein ABIO70_16755 [Pseudomonadota bacterium]